MSALPNSDSKLGGNPLAVVIAAMNNNEYSQQMREVAGSVQLNTADQCMGNLTEAMSGVSTDTGGFGPGGWLATGLVVAAVLVVGTAASFIIGPEAEVAADVVDGAIIEGALDVGAADVAVEAGGEVAAEAVSEGSSEIIGQTFDEAGNTIETVTKDTYSNKAGDAVEKTVTETGDESGITKRVTERSSGDVSETVTDEMNKGKQTRTIERRNGELTQTITGTVDKADGSFTAGSSKKYLTKKTIGMLGGTFMGAGVTVEMAMGANSAVSSVQTSEFTQATSTLNYLESIVTNTISSVNTQLINAANQLIQGAQTAVQGALSAWGSMFVVPPVQ